MRQIFFAGTGGGSPSSSATNYCQLSGAHTTNWFSEGSKASANTLIASDGTLRNLFVTLGVAPGSGKSWVFTVMKNDVATSLLVTISNTDTSASLTGTDVAVTAGDVVSLRSVPSGTPTAPASVSVNTEFQPSTATRYVLSGSSLATLRVNGTREYNQFRYVGTEGWNTSVSNNTQMSPHDATIKDFYVKLNAAPGAGTSFTFTIYNTGSQQAESAITISDSATSGSVNGLSINVSPGDRLLVSCISSGTPTTTTASWSACLQPDNDGEFVVGTAVGTDGSETSTEYHDLLTKQVWSATEAPMLHYLGFPYTLTISDLYIRLINTPGSGKSRQFVVRKNGADTDVSATVSDTSVTASNTTDEASFASGDSIAVAMTPSGTPNNGSGVNVFAVATLTGVSASSSVSASASSSASSSTSLSPSPTPSSSVSPSPSSSQSPSSSVSASNSPSQSVSSSVSSSASASQSPSSSVSKSASASVSSSQSPSSSASASLSPSPSPSPSASPSPVTWTNDTKASTTWTNDNKSQL